MGEMIGQFDVLGVLGTGGSGTVYRARDMRAGRTVAVRVLGDLSGDAASRAAFVRAVTPYLSISHPHVATLFAVGEHRDYPYLVYEFVPGDRLGELAAGRPINLRRAVDLVTQVADGLAEAHAFGLRHGALTPNAIVVTPKGHAKILDFGLSEWQPADAANHTAVRLGNRYAVAGPGAVAYMAPEQVLGQTADHRADLFALGVILYQLLTGRQPFEADRPDDTAVRIAQFTPPPPSHLAHDVPPDLDAIVMKAVTKDLDDRYGDAAAMASDLRNVASALLQRDAAMERSRVAAVAPPTRSSGRLWLLVLLLIAAIGAAGWSLRDRLGRTWKHVEGTQASPVVAVVPFSVGGGDVSRDYVGSGIAVELATRLGHIRGVRVKGGVSIRNLVGKPAVNVAAETGASFVVTGSVGPGPSGWAAVDVSVELVDGRDGASAWRSRYSSPAADLSALQARIARDIAAWFAIPQTSAAANDRASLRLVNPEAYDIYLQGLDARGDGDTVRAAQLFESALELDESLIDAQASLAEALRASVTFTARAAYQDVHDRMRRAAEEASTTDPDLASAQMALGLSADTYREALERLGLAIELDPSYTAAYLAVADVLRDVDPPRAIRFARMAAELDPTSPLPPYHEIAAMLSTGGRNASLALIARGQALAPLAPWWDALRQRASLIGAGTEIGYDASRSVSDFAPGALVRAEVLVRGGRPEEADPMLSIVTRVNPTFCEARALLAAVKVQEHKTAEARRLSGDVLAAARQAGDAEPWARCAALAAAAVGDADLAAFWVSKAASSERALKLWSETSAVLGPLPGIRQNVFPWDRVSSDARFKAAVGTLESALVTARGEVARTMERFERR
jgi:eukaryotic-like serine/threonine-protein kinase